MVSQWNAKEESYLHFSRIRQRVSCGGSSSSLSSSSTAGSGGNAEAENRKAASGGKNFASGADVGASTTGTTSGGTTNTGGGGDYYRNIADSSGAGSAAFQMRSRRPPRIKVSSCIDEAGETPGAGGQGEQLTLFDKYLAGGVPNPYDPEVTDLSSALAVGQGGRRIRISSSFSLSADQD